MITFSRSIKLNESANFFFLFEKMDSNETDDLRQNFEPVFLEEFSFGTNEFFCRGRAAAVF
jgi:hypothetical protein